MGEMSTKTAMKVIKLANSLKGVKRVVGFLGNDMVIKQKGNSYMHIIRDTTSEIGTITPVQEYDNNHYYKLYIKNSEYEVDGVVKQNGVCSICILKGKYEGYTIDFTFTETAHDGFVPRQIEIFNPNNEKISLSWCTWGQEGFEISNQYAKIKYDTQREYYMGCDYSDGSGLKGKASACGIRKRDTIIHQKNRKVESKKVSLNEVLEKPYFLNRVTGKPEFCDVSEAKKIVENSGWFYIKGHTVEEYIKNDSLGIMLLGQFMCLYSKLGFDMPLSELIGEKLVKSSGLSILFEAIDKEKKVSPRQKLKRLEMLQNK